MKHIPFNTPLVIGHEIQNIQAVLAKGKLSGDGDFTNQCHQWFEEKLKVDKVLLTTSCTHALEMAAILIGIKPGDEVIMPSYTFVSTANAFILHGAKVVFVDIRPDTMNIDELKIEAAITDKTKAIVPVHYAGVACEMETIMQIADKYKLYVIEDAAQGMMSSYHGRALGSIGHLGCYSFHETKNYTCGEGGLLIINDEKFIHDAEIIREKGTNRTQFNRGIVALYRWVSIGSSYLPSELNAAFLMAQLGSVDKINKKRLQLWHEYQKQLSSIKEIVLPSIPKGIKHNGHMFFIKLKNIRQRQDLIYHLASLEIQSVFHYIPLHESIRCKKYFRFHGENIFTSTDSERLLRLPMSYNLTKTDIKTICKSIKAYFK